MLFFAAENKWYFEDKEKYVHGPFVTREEALSRYQEYWEKQYAKPSQRDYSET